MSQNLAQYIVFEDSFVQTHNGFHQFFLKTPKFLVEFVVWFLMMMAPGYSRKIDMKLCMDKMCDLMWTSAMYSLFTRLVQLLHYVDRSRIIFLSLPSPSMTQKKKDVISLKGS